MPCFSPREGFRAAGGGFAASRRDSPTGVPMTVPCGGCIGCRMDRARQWGVRVAHEASLHEQSSFVTLTYNPENLPDDLSLSMRVSQLFIKRLRKAIAPTKLRFFGCGEYGPQTWRPHYHYIIFGYGFPDKVPWRIAPTGQQIYRSPLLESVWTAGHSEIGSVTRESGQYVAKYCLKKITGAPSEEHYKRVHPVTGEVFSVKPEFGCMSTKPGIGFGWFARFETDFNPSGFVVLDGVKYSIPRFYKKKLQGRNEDPSKLYQADDYRRLRLQSREAARSHPEDRTRERLAVREENAARKAAFYEQAKQDGIE